MDDVTKPRVRQVTMHCDVTGLPEPRITWLRSSVPLQSSGLIKVGAASPATAL